MKKVFKVCLILMMCVCCGSAFASDKDGKTAPKITDLTPWVGVSVPFSNLFANGAGKDFFAEVAKYAKGYTPEMVEAHYNKTYELDFSTLNVVDGDTITVDGDLTGDYVYVGNLSTKFEKYDITWEIFKTNSEKMINAGYKYFILFPFHQQNKGLRHAHMRYGNENFDYLATDPSVQKWWPTLYQPATTDEAAILDKMTKGAKLQASGLPAIKK